MKARRKRRKLPLPDIVAQLRQRRDKVSREAARAIVRLRADVAMLRERQRVSDKILAGMRRARREGKVIGGRNAMSAKQQAEGRERAEALRPLLAELGALSATQAAAEMNRRDVPSALGGKWHAMQVIRARKRLEATS